MPAFVHSDRGLSLICHELWTYLAEKGVATSRTTPYNPAGNGQIEKCNGTVWRAVTMACKSENLHIKNWQKVLHDVLHSIRSLLCTTTNETPHECLFRFSRRSTSWSSIPTWLTFPGPVFLKLHIQTKKTDPLVDEVELIEANPPYAHIRYPDGREMTVSTKHLAPCGKSGHDSLPPMPAMDEAISLPRPSLEPELNSRPMPTSIPSAAELTPAHIPDNSPIEEAHVIQNAPVYLSTDLPIGSPPNKGVIVVIWN